MIQYILLKERSVVMGTIFVSHYQALQVNRDPKKPFWLIKRV